MKTITARFLIDSQSSTKTTVNQLTKRAIERNPKKARAEDENREFIDGVVTSRWENWCCSLFFLSLYCQPHATSRETRGREMRLLREKLILSVVRVIFGHEGEMKKRFFENFTFFFMPKNYQVDNASSNQHIIQAWAITWLKINLITAYSKLTANCLCSSC